MDEDREAGEGLDSGGAEPVSSAAESVSVEFDGGSSGDDSGDGNAPSGDDSGEQPVKRGRGRPPGSTKEKKQPAERPGVLKFEADPEPATPRKRTPAAKKSAAQEMEMAAGMLTATVFAAIGALQGPHWRLNSGELSDIAGPLSQVLASLPGKQAKKAQKLVNDLSAPIALVLAVTAAAKPRIATDLAARQAKTKLKTDDKKRGLNELSQQPTGTGAAAGIDPSAGGAGQSGPVGITLGQPEPGALDVQGSRVIGM